MSKSKEKKIYDTSYTQNREVSWMRFDERVLLEAEDESVPLFERLKFVEIFTSNLDEFDMYLKKQCLKTTFNGIELDTFNWYKNILGFNK